MPKPLSPNPFAGFEQSPKYPTGNSKREQHKLDKIQANALGISLDHFYKIRNAQCDYAEGIPFTGTATEPPKGNEHEVPGTIHQVSAEAK